MADHLAALCRNQSGLGLKAGLQCERRVFIRPHPLITAIGGKPHETS